MTSRIVIEWAVEINTRVPQSFGSGHDGELKARMFITENEGKYDTLVLRSRVVTLGDWHDEP